VPRVYHASQKLRYRLVARPHRRPFLDFAKNDEFVAAYLNYDSLEELNRLPLYSGSVIDLANDFAMKRRPEK
jgi:hypothetical protein